jgi:hypothetical protein
MVGIIQEIGTITRMKGEDLIGITTSCLGLAAPW